MQDVPGAEPIWVLVSTEPVITRDGYLADPFYSDEVAVDRTTGRASLSAAQLLPLAGPGVYYWQAFRVDCDVSDARYCAVPSDIAAFRIGDGQAPVEAFTIGYNDDDLSYARIPRQVGVRRAFPYKVSTANLPDAVGYDRFLALAGATGGRWGLRNLGDVEYAVRSRDGRNTVGFSSAVDRDSLGVTLTLSRLFYRRGVVVRREVVERDIRISTRVSWHAGPGRPSSSQYDLQTTLIHEFGHYAGNGPHARRCANSPMATSMGEGDWWHSRTDWFTSGCRGGASAAAATAGASRRRLRFEHRDVVVERVYR